MAWQTRQLEAGGSLRLEPGFLAEEEAEEAAHALVHALEWEQRAVVLFGREIMQPRLVAWAGALPYRYSGQTLPPRDAPPVLRALWDRVVDTTGVDFNHVLVNRYRDGSDSMGWHSDDEPELGENPPVASLSLGATRRFVLKDRKRRFQSVALDLTHGSLLVMEGALQHRYRHALPKQPGVTRERINLTFRLVLRAPI